MEIAVSLQPWFILIGITIIIALQGVSLWLQQRRRNTDDSLSEQRHERLSQQWREYELHSTETHQYIKNELALMQDRLRDHSQTLESIQRLVDASMDIPAVIHDQNKVLLAEKCDELRANLQHIISQGNQNVITQQQACGREVVAKIEEHGLTIEKQSQHLIEATQNKIMAVNDSVQHTIIKTNEHIEFEVRTTRDYVENQLMSKSNHINKRLKEMMLSLTQRMSDSSKEIVEQIIEANTRAEETSLNLSKEFALIHQLFETNEQHIQSYISDTHEQQFPRIKKVIVQAYQALKQQHLDMQSLSQAMTTAQKRHHTELLQQMSSLMGSYTKDPLPALTPQPTDGASVEHQENVLS